MLAINMAALLVGFVARLCARVAGHKATTESDFWSPSLLFGNREDILNLLLINEEFNSNTTTTGPLKLLEAATLKPTLKFSHFHQQKCSDNRDICDMCYQIESEKWCITVVNLLNVPSVVTTQAGKRIKSTGGSDGLGQSTKYTR